MMGRASSPNRVRESVPGAGQEKATKLRFAKPIRPAETTNLERHLPDDETPSAVANEPQHATTNEPKNVQL
jgi:hypothetical protein